jgi:predicted DNA-binding transcriptional regulator AlpA
MDDRLVNERDAAEYLALSVKTMQGYRTRGGGPVYLKLGSRTVRYRKSDLDAWTSRFANTAEYDAAH